MRTICFLALTALTGAVSAIPFCESQIPIRASNGVSATTLTSSMTNGTANHPYDDIDVQCEEGYYAGFHTSFFKYNIPPEAFFNATGSFFNSAWYVSTAHPRFY